MKKIIEISSLHLEKDICWEAKVLLHNFPKLYLDGIRDNVPCQRTNIFCTKYTNIQKNGNPNFDFQPIFHDIISTLKATLHGTYKELDYSIDIKHEFENAEIRYPDPERILEQFKSENN